MRSKMLPPAVVLSAVIVFAALPTGAQTMPDHNAHHAMPSSSAPAALTTGEVRNVDREAGKMVLRHGPIPNLDMPNMTMVFRVKDPAMLDRLKAGDTVKFAADNIDGQLTVTRLERAPR